MCNRFKVFWCSVWMLYHFSLLYSVILPSAKMVWTRLPRDMSNGEFVGVGPDVQWVMALVAARWMDMSEAVREGVREGDWAG